MVTQTLEGRASTLKERTLAVEVFDRSASWDSGDDTIVRVGAREVRKRLAQYYTSPEAAVEKIRIELHSGSYVPEFFSVEHASVFSETPLKSLEQVSLAALPPPLIPVRNGLGRHTRSHWPVGFLVLCAVVLGIALVFGSKPSLFDQFWAPFWSASNPVLVAIANPLVYHPSDRATRLNVAKLGPSAMPGQLPLQLLPDQLNGSDMIPVPDQYVGFGDASVAAQVFALLAKHSKEARLRFASKSDFDDFREAPAVLIGAYTNRWSIGVSREGHMVQSVRDRPRLKDSGLVAGEAPWREKQDGGALRQHARKGVCATHQVATCSERRSSLVTRFSGG